MALNAIYFKDESSTHAFSNRAVSLMNSLLALPVGNMNRFLRASKRFLFRPLTLSAMMQI